MTEVLKNGNEWILKDGNVGDYLRPAFNVYGSYLGQMREIAAGPESDEKPVSTDEMQLQVLKELGIETTADLRCLLNSNGVTYQMLEDLQTPYLDHKDAGMWQQVKNPKYGKDVEGITFDDKYAVDHFMSILPNKKEYFSCDYTVNYMKDYYAKQEEIKNQNKLINAYEEIIKQAFRKNFNESRNISLVKIARGESLPVDHIFLGEVLEVEKSLAMLCMEKADDVDFEKLLIEWYLNMKKNCTRLNFYF